MTEPGPTKGSYRPRHGPGPVSASRVIGPNPAYAGKKPTLLKATCHDGTPFLTVECDNDHELHVHESQLPPEPAEVGLRCPTCGEVLVFAPGQIEEAFAQMREEGWLE